MHSLHSLQRPAVVLSLEMVGRPMRTIAPRVPPGNLGGDLQRLRVGEPERLRGPWNDDQLEAGSLKMGKS